MPALILELRRHLASAGDPSRAPRMQAYMKSTMPYHGISAPIFKKLANSFFQKLELSSAATWQNHLLEIWRNAKFREERYAALHLAADKRALDFHTPQSLEVFEEMIVTGAWWDYIDVIAPHRIGYLLKKHPKFTRQQMVRWSKSDNLWKRRSSIICQLYFRKETDLDFLYACIEPSLDSKEFFLRKAIGWALREYAWTDSKEVSRYVKKNEKRLSPLSRREAMKNILKKKC